MSTDAPAPMETPAERTPPTEVQRAARAVALGVVLGAVLAVAGRRSSRGRV